MNIAMFYHSLISDWNHGNAHFLRGMYTSLQKMGHQVAVYEEKDNWSLAQLIKERGKVAIQEFTEQFPDLEPHFYDQDTAIFDHLVNQADLVIVHEWTSPSLVKLLGELKRKYGYTLLFHDTHHRGVSAKEEMRKFDLSDYDGVLAFGESLKRTYLEEKWHQRVWTWHEGADTAHYYPHKQPEKKGDLIWVGNWGDGERTKEIQEFLLEPVRRLGLRATFYGVRYPREALMALDDLGITYGGYLPTHQVAREFSNYKFTIHVPRRFYAESLPGIPTIRPFEAMACGIPLFSAPWQDSEHLFEEGKEYLMARNGDEMTQMISKGLKVDWELDSMANNGLAAIRERHSCDIRAQELMEILHEIRQPAGHKEGRAI